MTWTRTAVLGIVGGTLVTLLARASMLSVSLPAPVDAAPAAAAIDHEALVTDLARLRARQRRLAAPVAPSRNPFEFRAAPAPHIDVPSPSASSATSAPHQAAPPPTLVGLAEDDGPDGRVRTAIIADSAGLHFVKTGDAVPGGYRVAAIREDAVELAGAPDGLPVVLRLK